MKMVKSLLLGSAAGLVAVAGAQAADLPVKAKPVEYVKVCSLYGAGYYYMPGSDICLKLGGFVRYQYTVNPGSTISNGPFSGAGGRNTMIDDYEGAHRSRYALTIDTRQQTAYGTLRTYMLIGASQDTQATATFYTTRGFIQIAGFTLGKATSFFDIMPAATFSYNSGTMWTTDTGDSGTIVAAYTAQLGNGLSATFAAQQAQRRNTTWTGPGAAASFLVGSATGSINQADNSLVGVPQGEWATDWVANLRLDQAWGSALVAVATGDRSGSYFGTTIGGVAPGVASDEWGYALTAGFVLNLPMIAPGDRLSAQVVYTEGMIAYLGASMTGSFTSLARFEGNTLGYGILTDGVYSNPAGFTSGNTELTTGWAVAAAFEHLWTPSLRTSIYGSYLDISYSANANAAICANANTAPTFGPATSGCNQDFSAWNVGTRTQWEPTRGLLIGVDVVYNKLNTAQSNSGGVAGQSILTAASGARGVGTYVTKDQEEVSFSFRVHRDFLP